MNERSSRSHSVFTLYLKGESSPVGLIGLDSRKGIKKRVRLLFCRFEAVAVFHFSVCPLVLVFVSLPPALFLWLHLQRIEIAWVCMYVRVVLDFVF